MLGAESDAALLRFGAEPRPWADADENATATINYTSGTTARPEGRRAHAPQHLAQRTMFALHPGITDRDVYLHTVPMFHANGWSLPFALAALGVPQVVLRKVDGAEILRRIEAHGVTLTGGAPAVLDIALDAAAACRNHARARARCVLCGGAPPPTRTIARVESELGWEFMQIYGLTETSPLLVINRARAEDAAAGDDERHRRLDPRRRARARRRAAHGARRRDPRPLQPRAQGLLARSPRRPPRRSRGGWFHTGDGGRIEDGYLTVSDRKKDMIITGGENVASIEVENRLHRHPGVAEVAVIGVPDRQVGRDRQGDRRARRRRADVTEAELIAHAREGSRTTSARPRSSSSPRCRAPSPARCRSSCCASPTGPATSARSPDRVRVGCKVESPGATPHRPVARARKAET